MNTSKIKIGFLGAGNFALRRANLFSSIPGVEVTLAWSRREASRERFHRETDASVTDKWRDVCKSKKVNTIVVSTPNVFHFEQARDALTHHKHVLIETPLCMEYSQAQELTDLAAHNGLVIHHGVQPRYHPDHDREIKDLQRVGKLLHAERVYSFDGGPERPWYRDLALSGGAYSYLSWAAMDFFQAFGNVVEVDGHDLHRGKLHVVTMLLRFAAGGQASVTCGIGKDFPEVTGATVIGTEGTIQWTQSAMTRVLRRGEQFTELASPREADPLGLECHAFIDEICGRRPFIPTLEMDLNVLRAVSQCKAHAATKSPSVHNQD